MSKLDNVHDEHSDRDHDFQKHFMTTRRTFLSAAAMGTAAAAFTPLFAQGHSTSDTDANSARVLDDAEARRLDRRKRAGAADGLKSRATLCGAAAAQRVAPATPGVPGRTVRRGLNTRRRLGEA
jgi:hypothetical protein